MSSVSRLRCLLPIVLCGIYCLFSPAIAGTVHLKNGRVIRGPVVAKVSLRRKASKIDSRVFSSAHTPASPDEPKSPDRDSLY